jgi:F420H(2)-dependent quinone reductase
MPVADDLTGIREKSVLNQGRPKIMFQLRTYTRLLMRAAPLLNAPVAVIATSPRFGGMLRRNITMITYTGRRSGKTFTIPVAYRRRGDEIEIAPNMPDAKTWWRNFLGDGAPLTLSLDGREHAGHAVAHRDDNGRVTVTVRLTTSITDEGA